jgi:hypothetical protein
MAQALSWDNLTVANKEDFHNVAINIAPEQTPLLTSVGEGYPVTNTKHQWLTDTLASPTANAIVEGATISPSARAAAVRLYNETQMSEKSYYVSDIQDAIQMKQGGNLDSGNQQRKAVIELKRDIEYAMTINATRTAFADSVAGTIGGLPYWVNTANYTNANTVDAASAALTESMLLQAMQAQWEDHEPEQMTVLCNSTNKLRIDGFSGGAVRNTDANAKMLINTIKVYESSFGNFKLIMSRYCTTGNLYVLDTNYIKKGFLIPITQKAVAYTKHRNEFVVFAAYTMEMRAIDAHARVLNIV